MTPFEMSLVAVAAIGAAAFAFIVWYSKQWPKLLEPDDPDHRRIFANLPLGQFIEVDGFKVRFIQQGQGPDLVLIHGFGESIMTWRLLFNSLAENFRVTALDLPGCGFSTKRLDRDYGLDEQADRCWQFLDLMRIKKPHLMGHSMGGAISVWMAKKRPHDLGKLVLLAPAVNRAVSRIHPAATQWIGAMTKSFIVTPRLVKQIYRYCLTVTPPDFEKAVTEAYRPFHQSPEAVTTFLRHNWLLNDKRMPAELAGLVNAALVIAGRNDRVVRLNMLDEFLRLNPQVTCRVLEQTGHQIQEENPDQVLSLALNFLKGG